jgi:hypothetical protein
MRPILSERNLVVLLFIMVLVTFSFAQEDSKKMERIATGVNAKTASGFLTGLEQANHISPETSLPQ